MPTRLATFTLSDSPDAPTATFAYTGQALNGVPIVIATMDDVNRYLRTLAKDDPNGSWSELEAYVDVERETLMLHDCSTTGCDLPDHDYDSDVVIGGQPDGSDFVVIWPALRGVTA